VTSDWCPRDAYERRWVLELVTAMWRQDRLRGLELAVLTAAEQESPPGEATVRKLGTFARYGARIEKDMAAALQALHALRKRPDAWLEELQDGTREPGGAEALTRKFTNELPPRTCEPGPANTNEANGTCEPRPSVRNHHERRRLAALARKRAA
jgi:hypothetical protein